MWHSRRSSHVSPAMYARPALTTRLKTFMPVDATLAPGPDMPPSKSDSRVGVRGKVCPLRGPDNNVDIAWMTCENVGNSDMNIHLPSSAAASYHSTARPQSSAVLIPLQYLYPIAICDHTVRQRCNITMLGFGNDICVTSCMEKGEKSL